jgi:hypothetical protein
VGNIAADLEIATGRSHFALAWIGTRYQVKLHSTTPTQMLFETRPDVACLVMTV